MRTESRHPLFHFLVFSSYTHGGEMSAASMPRAPPEATLSVLPRVDGSARYSYAGYTVTGSVNGPIEAQRREELIFEAHVDVIVRPATGVGGELASSLKLSLPTYQYLRTVLPILYLPKYLRHKRKTPRVAPAVFPFSPHPHEELPTLPHPDCAANRVDA